MQSILQEQDMFLQSYYKRNINMFPPLGFTANTPPRLKTVNLLLFVLRPNKHFDFSQQPEDPLMPAHKHEKLVTGKHGSQLDSSSVSQQQPFGFLSV